MLDAGMLQLSILLIVALALLIYLLRPRQVTYHMGDATPAKNGRRRMVARGDLLGMRYGFGPRRLPGKNFMGILKYRRPDITFRA